MKVNTLIVVLLSSTILLPLIFFIYKSFSAKGDVNFVQRVSSGGGAVNESEKILYDDSIDDMLNNDDTTIIEEVDEDEEEESDEEEPATEAPLQIQPLPSQTSVVSLSSVSRVMFFNKNITYSLNQFPHYGNLIEGSQIFIKNASRKSFVNFQINLYSSPIKFIEGCEHVIPSATIQVNVSTCVSDPEGSLKINGVTVEQNETGLLPINKCELIKKMYKHKLYYVLRVMNKQIYKIDINQEPLKAISFYKTTDDASPIFFKSI
ncbi:hypothetical protein CCFV1_ORF059 [Cotesia congregata filamentous virus 1]|uniref:Uncharacterized protein n=1 Tax=Cotesia congregata filamentous virus 1 TaxID=3064291 RepID=A0ABC8QS45_9VIRU|nr:hypothetical protein CCFV1_ORF059 [Cotesia congregata filamentous virus 1]